MGNLTPAMANRLRTLFRPKAIIVGISICNFVIYYLEATKVRGMIFCFGAPWYASPTWSHFPLLLLIAALGLYARRWWSLLAAVAFSAPVVYQGVVDNLPTVGLYWVWDWVGYQPGLLIQYVLAAVLLGMSVQAVAQRLRH